MHATDCGYIARLISTRGGSIAAVYFRPHGCLTYEFASHRFNRFFEKTIAIFVDYNAISFDTLGDKRE